MVIYIYIIFKAEKDQNDVSKQDEQNFEVYVCYNNSNLNEIELFSFINLLTFHLYLMFVSEVVNRRLFFNFWRLKKDLIKWYK